ncbi:MAG: excinuclease ABC subunit A [Candidatus Staskawiczbacteria bacterium RIFOXYB1_FULL_37_44]|uniref:UvrABC system protein A n=1 Tax=Candidatus Staskawiczbacteria bacterium RIFOXYB1_FULL_37_44 TaxID=1802223 RepID=A0A1G2IWM9_9BACT|nr:MAG: excinuclease ABC subunit A [Candidatus Staskawiczbacteria bacterium RIFOXYB1_FULL_37_44]OGZ84444.1 MAG: excinuclease ABC subunit A [Candidatus Staskawiczbacteria bacterium RIFOXYC1_FULL_37_52]OGZ88523.1 MAG: excinuclease ABC subunit A [Candidatus Staskawiczbacteria bacterium RIFOXYC2_FULL_37_19]OGZ89881.1 MAG: excinuclease ABC subunit A [Candidatus Staskawiczbacteria bacterium RIFOXYD1_FULL_37_110]
MQNEFIKIRGARVHNLKNIDLDIPKNKLVVITGLSGSGKSSLAFDTLYAEGQRRYVESLSAYARQFLGVMDKPDVDKIDGISPAISIDQRKAMHNPRSTVGTITEIYDYLRLLYARIGKPHCPNCRKPISRQTIDQIVDQVLKLSKNSEVTIMGPVIRSKKGEHRAVLEEIQRGGFVRVRIDGNIYLVEESIQKQLDKQKKHNIEVVVDRLILNKDLDRSRLVDSLEISLRLGKGIVIINSKKEDLIFSEHFACEECGISLPELEPRIFSFNNPYGACPECTGLGEKLEVDPELVIPNKRLTLAEGAVWPWSRASHKVGRQGYFSSKIFELAQKHNFSVDEEVKDLPKKIIDIILYGDGEFEGVVQNLERRYHETDSDWTRQEIEQYMVIKQCPKCKGKRLKPEVLAITVNDISIDKIVEMSLEKLKDFFNALPESKVSKPITKEISERLQFLNDVGLGYLTLGRKAGTLAGGEEQRIRLATQIGSKLSGVLYILDEPSVGLHARDQHRLIETLVRLKELGNSVIVVEHDPQTMMASDWIIDIGPGAGKHGGKVVFQGTPKQLLKSNCLTGKYLSGRLSVIPASLAESRRAKAEGPVRAGIQSKSTDSGSRVKPEMTLEIKGAQEHNLKNIDAKIPLGKFVCVTGVSGSGKSSLVNDILAKALLKKFYRAKDEPGKHKEILGVENLNKVVLVDQSPIGRTPRSNPATYTGAFSYIRDIFTKTKEARVRGYSAGRFSFNVKGGRCEACEGQGVKKVEMYFLPDIYVECEECRGKRYNKEVLEIDYKGKNIADVLSMTVEESMEFFKNIPGLYEKMKTLKEVGLSYLELGQSATSLSGGEAQRVKLATELSRKGTGRTLYILDEPTTGLHFEDIKKLVSVLRGLVDKENTVLVIEHNTDFIRCADWILDLGPEGGEAGGQIVAEGTPSDIIKNKRSYTGKYL